MKETDFVKEFKKADLQMDRVMYALETIERHLKSMNNDNAAESSVMLCNEVEKLWKITRQLPKYTGNPRYYRDAGYGLKHSLPIEVGFTGEGWFMVYIPELLPSKKQGSSDYMQSCLIDAMEQFFNENSLLLFSKCTMAICNVYSRDTDKRDWRDYDNIEYKDVQDILASFVLADDNPVTCHQYYCSMYGDEDATIFYFIPPEDFTLWLTYYLGQMDLPLIEDNPDNIG